MLELKTTLQPDAVENLFCKKFEKLPCVSAEEEDMEILGKLLLSKKTSLSDAPIEEKDKPFLYKVIEKSLKFRFDFKINDSRLIIFLCAIARTPGAAIMYLAYLQFWCKKHNIREIDIEFLWKEIFPAGFPSEEDLHKLWTETKVNTNGEGGSDNLLDYARAYQSILFGQYTFPNRTDRKENNSPKKKPVRGTFIYGKGFAIINGIRREKIKK